MKTKKEKLTIVWPSTHFTIKDIQSQHPTAKNITLRFRINRAIEDGVIAYIGKNEATQGRPTIVFAPCPVEDIILRDAVNGGVILDEKYQPHIVTVAQIRGDLSSEVSEVNEKVKISN